MILPDDESAGECGSLTRWVGLLENILDELDASGRALPAIHVSYSIDLLKLELGSAAEDT